MRDCELSELRDSMLSRSVKVKSERDEKKEQVMSSLIILSYRIVNRKECTFVMDLFVVVTRVTVL